MKYFDFHCHPVLKQLFNDDPNIDAYIYKNDVATLPKLCSDLPNIIETQTHQSQLSEFQDEVILGAVLYSVERNVADTVIPLRGFLKKASQFKLSEQLLKDIVSNNNKPFSDFLMKRTLDKYLQATSSFNILAKESFKSPLPKNKVNVFFTIEGCHSLVDAPNFCDANNKYKPSDILSNLDKVLTKVPIISINITHLQQSSLCNQAFGMQVADSTKFFPSGNGFENDGRTVVQGIFDRKICVDVKHMSYKSRKDLMSEIDSKKYKNIQPLVCTHAGFTGVSFKDWAGQIQLKKPLSGALYLEITKSLHSKNNPRRPGFPSFNASTINLFDEEIAWIVKNGGVIGISMDRRILGYVDKFDDNPVGITGMDRIVDKEFFSKTEWTSLGIKNEEIGTSIDDNDCLLMTELEENTESSIPQRDEYFYDHILNHIKHYFQVCKDNGIPINIAQKQITIGTDFDGLINPFINMPTVKNMRDVRSYISMNLKYFLKDLKDSKKWADELNIDIFMEDIFYNNGYRFLKSRF
ncbi:hypothetical protein [Chryseobacterium sp. MMS23-Vi53]|uniref:hypothetical protein n=1 Tax=Chryseobacterium sp. MMS23-Vi53 TaxID=3386644 RepID=UPI0039EC9112